LGRGALIAAIVVPAFSIIIHAIFEMAARGDAG
jgi:hypothetical protein